MLSDGGTYSTFLLSKARLQAFGNTRAANTRYASGAHLLLHVKDEDLVFLTVPSRDY